MGIPWVLAYKEELCDLKLAKEREKKIQNFY
jgi:hypothetical protein